MKYELVVHLCCNCMVVCSNIGRHELSFLFAKILFGMKVNGQTNLMAIKLN